MRALRASEKKRFSRGVKMKEDPKKKAAVEEAELRRKRMESKRAYEAELQSHKQHVAEIDQRLSCVPKLGQYPLQKLDATQFEMPPRIASWRVGKGKEPDDDDEKPKPPPKSPYPCMWYPKNAKSAR